MLLNFCSDFWRVHSGGLCKNTARLLVCLAAQIKAFDDDAEARVEPQGRACPVTTMCLQVLRAV